MPAQGIAAPMVSTRAVHNASDVPLNPGPDQSRHARLAGDARWRCPFPPEADTAQVDSAVVRLRVDVDVSGKATRVSVLKDPGFGFGREAMRCALASAWTPALNRSGAPLDATSVVDVRFER
jgi:protein TonB